MDSRFIRRYIVHAALFAALSIGNAQAAFRQVDNFELLIPGNVDGQSDWVDGGDGATEFDFRTGGNSDLINFFIKTRGGSSSVLGTFYLDDICVSLAPQDPGNPTVVPRPVPFALMPGPAPAVA